MYMWNTSFVISLFGLSICIFLGLFKSTQFLLVILNYWFKKDFLTQIIEETKKYTKNKTLIFSIFIPVFTISINLFVIAHKESIEDNYRNEFITKVNNSDYVFFKKDNCYFYIKRPKQEDIKFLNNKIFKESQFIDIREFADSAPIESLKKILAKKEICK